MLSLSINQLTTFRLIISIIKSMVSFFSPMTWYHNWTWTDPIIIIFNFREWETHFSYRSIIIILLTLLEKLWSWKRITTRNITIDFADIFLLTGKKVVKIEISGKQKVTGVKSTRKSAAPSGLECKLDKLRKELASMDGGIFPHSVLSTQQISVLSAQKPTSLDQANLLNINFNLWFWKGCLLVA